MKDNWGNRVMPLTRRNFLVQSLVFGGAVAMPAWAGKVLAADDGVLRARLYNDVNSLDPAIYQNAYNVDVMRSEEHTSELQSLMRISYAVFCLKKKKNRYRTNSTI